MMDDPRMRCLLFLAILWGTLFAIHVGERLLRRWTRSRWRPLSAPRDSHLVPIRVCTECTEHRTKVLTGDLSPDATVPFHICPKEPDPP